MATTRSVHATIGVRDRSRVYHVAESPGPSSPFPEMGNQTPSHPPHDDTADWEAIARYFAGESTSDEAVVVRRWLEAHPTEAAALRALGDATADLSSATAPDLDVEAALASVTRRRLSEDQAGAADVI